MGRHSRKTSARSFAGNLLGNFFMGVDQYAGKHRSKPAGRTYRSTSRMPAVDRSKGTVYASKARFLPVGPRFFLR